MLVLCFCSCNFESKASNLTGWQTRFGFYSFNMTLRQAAAFFGLFGTSLQMFSFRMGLLIAEVQGFQGSRRRRSSSLADSLNLLVLSLSV